jgi:hypothetical protein
MSATLVISDQEYALDAMWRAYKSVNVVSPFDEIAWREVSRFIDDEMRPLLVGAHPRVQKMLAAYTSIDAVTCLESRIRPTQNAS